MAWGKAEHAIMLDTATLKYDYVPAKFGDYCHIDNEYK
ncbi:galactokinase [Staphylococcus gallinarum]|uniref:Galactokinase n=1 Tax=Staphylococcus gallinarum TaxID=1293 RepID=A0A380FMT6_STAGA|nr:galactokinase [Staphylococcus gallinarum]